MNIAQQLKDLEDEIEKTEPAEETENEELPTEDRSPEEPIEEIAEVEAEEVVVEQEEKLDASAHRKRRLEERARQQRYEEIEEENRRLREPKVETKVNDDPEPDRNTNYGAWLEWDNRQLKKQVQSLHDTIMPTIQQQRQTQLVQDMVRGLDHLETEFKKTTPDYDAAASFYESEMTRGVKRLNPFMNDAQVKTTVFQQKLAMAETFAQQGLNPAEEVYGLALDAGYSKEVKEEKVEAEKPDMSKVAANRARNSGMAGAKGTGGEARLTDNDVARMTPKDWAKLTPEQKKALMA